MCYSSGALFLHRGNQVHECVGGPQKDYPKGICGGKQTPMGSPTLHHKGSDDLAAVICIGWVIWKRQVKELLMS